MKNARLGVEECREKSEEARERIKERRGGAEDISKEYRRLRRRVKMYCYALKVKIRVEIFTGINKKHPKMHAKVCILRCFSLIISF